MNKSKSFETFRCMLQYRTVESGNHHDIHNFANEMTCKISSREPFIQETLQGKQQQYIFVPLA